MGLTDARIPSVLHELERRCEPPFADINYASRAIECIEDCEREIKALRADNAQLREVLAGLATELESESVVDSRSGTHRGRMYEKHIAGGKARLALRLRDAIASYDDNQKGGP